jgi:hypothetical protein
MAGRVRPGVDSARRPPLGMQQLWHVAGWGICATIAVGLAAAASYSEKGSRRLMLALNANQAEEQRSKPVKPDPSRADETGIEGPRLAEPLRKLSADRAALVTRIERIERHLDEVTGSIKAQAAMAQGPMATPGSAPTASSSPSDYATLATARQGGGGMGASGTPASAAPALNPERPAPADQPKFGIDIGSAGNFDGLRQLWTSLKSSHPSLLEGLNAFVALRENARTRGAELRLIVGPFPDLETATHLCSALAAAKRYCRPAGFEGQRLVDVDNPAERKPSAPRTSRKASGLKRFRVF